MVDDSLIQRSRVVVLATGGTIAGRAAAAGDNIGYVAGQVDVADMLRGIDAPAGIELVGEQVAHSGRTMSEEAALAPLRRPVTCALTLSSATSVDVT